MLRRGTFLEIILFQEMVEICFFSRYHKRVQLFLQVGRYKGGVCVLVGVTWCFWICVCACMCVSCFHLFGVRVYLFLFIFVTSAETQTLYDFVSDRSWEVN